MVWRGVCSVVWCGVVWCGVVFRKRGVLRGHMGARSGSGSGSGSGSWWCGMRSEEVEAVGGSQSDGGGPGRMKGAMGRG
jgi:hypothetical protein